MTEPEPEPPVKLESISSPRLQPPSMTYSNIESYFLSLEFWFAASGFGAQTQYDTRKYNIVMAQVPPNKLTELRSIIDNVPATEKYPYIKKKLTEHFADSQKRRLQRVLSDMPLGDMKPSQLFNEMKRVAGNSLGETVLMDLWATRLPPHAQAAVIASKGDAAEKTTIADAIVDSMGLRNIHAIDMKAQQTPSSSTHVADKPTQVTIETLHREIAQLSRKLEKMFSARGAGGYRGRSRSRSRGRGKSTSVSRDKTPSDEQCWYHRVFGHEARQCRKPCSFGQPSSSGTASKQ
ncbi:uncharacterized protein LOC129761381 [Toxorhynchites rutilus septentrionalis]|uniref:uncharacterized protein LOC129761381 n=1 Tax=Toxorhynchites rutilus septentrionalis TaxID=329112 RepID=UPI00247A5A32|nr:uncharacterized protein LOC129761381 [Toxorhynchites rutilus septentrionalis]